MENNFRKFLEEYESRVIPLFKETHLSFFNASVSGKKEDYEKVADLEIEISKYFSNAEKFNELKKFKDSGEIRDSLLKRQLDLIFNEFAAHQFDPELQEKIIKLSTQAEEKYSTYRASVNNKELTDNEVDTILESSKDSDELKNVWEASKKVGEIVANDVISLAKMRNEAARSLGFNNYHQMSLELSEQNSSQIQTLFDELDNLTRDEFLKLKLDIDNHLAGNYGIAKEDLMPWHYQDKYFQQGPKIYEADLNSYFEHEDLVKITHDYFEGIGLSIDDLIEKSDLFEKEGKYQHAFCTNIDKEGDVRVVCNLKPDHRWMSTMLHEYGHAVYSKFVAKELPWQLRDQAHIFTTEAIAMLFGRLASNPQWLQDVIGISDLEKEKIAKDCFNSLRLEQLIFSRWVQVMFRFEKAMYENPDQDLNSLWWKLVEKYQNIKKPKDRDKPDWASKIHIALYPAYYHNYMLGELLASQLNNFISKRILHSDNEDKQSFSGHKEVGSYLKENIFMPGARYHWTELIKRATGEELTPYHYANQFINNAVK
jgi:peptidyl-dipeptidase A